MANFIPSDYVDVQQRIAQFWQEHPKGRIYTHLMSPTEDFERCRFVAIVYRGGEDVPAATGYAFELAGGQGANRTSHEENCETSAIGRALANFGYATRSSDRPSRQEMEKVARGAEQGRVVDAPVATEAPPRGADLGNGQRVVAAEGEGSFMTPAADRGNVGRGKASEKQVRWLRGLAKEHNPDKDVTAEGFLLGQIYARFQVTDVHDLSGGVGGQASKMIDYLRAGDLVDAVYPAQARVDPVEARQHVLSAVPEEPEHLRAAWERNATWQ